MNIEDIKSINRIVAHTGTEPCADGRLSALLALDALDMLDVDSFEVLFMNYNSDAHVALEPRPGTLFADFAPHPSRLQEWVDAGTWVFDHHPTQEATVNRFGERGVFRSGPGICGATITYDELWKPAAESLTGSEVQQLMWLRIIGDVKDIASIAGVYDTWQKGQDFRASQVQAAALTFYPWEKLVAVVRDQGWTALEDLVELVGGALVSQSETAARSQLAGANTQHVGNVKCLFAETASTETNLVSDFAPDDIDLTVGWNYRSYGDVQKLHVSLRSKNKPGQIHCGNLAKVHGGGGHAGSAGFSLVADIHASPYKQLWLAIFNALEAVKVTT